MRYLNLRSNVLRLAAVPLATAGLLSVLLPVQPSSAVDIFSGSSKYRSNPRQYQECASDLAAAGLSSESVAEACAAALYPTDLSTCVSRIDEGTTIATDEVLSGCRRVRRPVDLASCVVNINEGIPEGTDTLSVLNNCRRSLLPLRFSACVVGLRSEIDFSVETAMSDCIAASSRPRGVLPSFVPIEDGIPTTPSRIEDNTLFPDEAPGGLVPTPSTIPSTTPSPSTTP